MVRFELPPRGSFAPNGASDPLRYYYAPILGRVFVARLNLGLSFLEGRPRRLLEIGYGSGLLLPTLAHAADAVDGLDLESDPDTVRAALARAGVTNVDRLVRGSACAIPLEDETYDAAIAFSILEHLREDELRRAAPEVARVLRPGGVLLVGCPAVHRAMNLAFRAIGFHEVDDHHFSGIRDVLRAFAPHFTVERTATLPRGLPLGLAPYNVVRLRRGA